MKTATTMNRLKKAIVSAGIILPAAMQAAESNTSGNTAFSNPLFNTLLAVIILLAIVAIALAGALKNLVSSELFTDWLKKRKDNASKAATIVLTLSAFSASAQGTAKSIDTIGGLAPTTFYFMVCVIGLEMIIIGVLFSILRNLLATEKKKAAVKEKAKATVTLFDRINDTVELEKEEEILLDHEYDGIRELDNNLPPWWKYGFYLTILVAVVYMINYHITGTSPLQAEEYRNSIKKAEAEVAEYMKNSASNVDETTVKMLSDPADIAAGKDIFVASCAACHGRNGEGGVGPNLTDEYWLHSGSVPEIFKTIKYGWPDKGMKAWKDDFSPVQIAQITSFIRTLKNTNPPNGKEKQGELYIEQGQPADTLKKDGEPRTVSQLLNH
jgi:cytochrome c oxidase cbb3-type subunit III